MSQAGVAVTAVTAAVTGARLSARVHVSWHRPSVPVVHVWVFVELALSVIRIVTFAPLMASPVWLETIFTRTVAA